MLPSKSDLSTAPRIIRPPELSKEFRHSDITEADPIPKSLVSMVFCIYYELLFGSDAKPKYPSIKGYGLFFEYFTLINEFLVTSRLSRPFSDFHRPMFLLKSI